MKNKAMHIIEWICWEKETGSELRSRKWGEGRMCLSLKSVSVDCDICVPMLNYSWEGWINDSSSLPVHIHFKASSETHTREEKAGRLTG